MAFRLFLISLLTRRPEASSQMFLALPLRMNGPAKRFDASRLAQNPVRMKRLPQGRAFQRLERRALTEEECPGFMRAARELDTEHGMTYGSMRTFGSR